MNEKEWKPVFGIRCRENKSHALSSCRQETSWGYWWWWLQPYPVVSMDPIESLSSFSLFRWFLETCSNISCKRSTRQENWRRKPEVMRLRSNKWGKGKDTTWNEITKQNARRSSLFYSDHRLSCNTIVLLLQALLIHPFSCWSWHLISFEAMTNSLRKSCIYFMLSRNNANASESPNSIDFP